jgi:hypothetical protein
MLMAAGLNYNNPTKKNYKVKVVERKIMAVRKEHGNDSYKSHIKNEGQHK